MSRARTIATTFVAVLAAASFLSCGSPVHDDQVAALGSDPTGQHNGPLHRAGQPCVTCHGSLGPSHTEFAVGGTIFVDNQGLAPAVGAIVTFTTLDNDSVAVQTNAAGNFYVTKDKWPLSFPVRVSVSYNGTDAQMGSRIGRDGSCADCHYDPRSQTSTGHVYITAK